jgi:hypothetical protein
LPGATVAAIERSLRWEDTMDTTHGTIPIPSTSVARLGRVIVVGLALVAALSSSFVVGRVTASQIQASARPVVVAHEGPADRGVPPFIRPARGSGAVKRGWASTSGLDVTIRPGGQHHVKRG